MKENPKVTAQDMQAFLDKLAEAFEISANRVRLQ